MRQRSPFNQIYNKKQTFSYKLQKTIISHPKTKNPKPTQKMNKSQTISQLRNKYQINIKRRISTENSINDESKISRVEWDRNVHHASVANKITSGVVKRNQSNRLERIGVSYEVTREKEKEVGGLGHDESDQSQKQLTIPNKIKNVRQTEKDQILSKLKARNTMLKQQILMIQKLEQDSAKKQKKQYSVDALYYASSTKDSLQQELYNAYNKIKRMEVDIKELRDVKKMDQHKKVSGLRERLQQIQKVKQERIAKLQQLKKSNKKAEQKITQYRSGGGYRQTIIDLNIQIDLLKQKESQLIQAETKTRQKITKQQDYIRKLQKQLAENGVSRQFIQNLMKKIMYGEKPNSQDKVEAVQGVRRQSYETIQKQYKKAEHEITIFKKSIKDQEKLLQEVTNLLKIALAQCQKSRLLFQQLDQEIKQLEAEVLQMRKTINPSKMKPKPLPPKEPTLQEQKVQQKQHLKQIRKKFYEKKTKRYLKSLENMQEQRNQFNQSIAKSKQEKQSSIQIQENIESQNFEKKLQVNAEEEEQKKTGNDQIMEIFQVFGQFSENGTEFTDKAICDNIGEEQCQITGLTVTISTNTSNIISIKTQYNYKQDSQPHQYTPSAQKQKNDKNQPQKSPSSNRSNQSQQFMCVQDEHITSITGTFSKQKILVNLTIITNLNRYHKFGSVLTNHSKKDLTEFEISSDGNTRPIYIFGCINELGICQFGAKVKNQTNNQDRSQQN